MIRRRASFSRSFKSESLECRRRERSARGPIRNLPDRAPALIVASDGPLKKPTVMRRRSRPRPAALSDIAAGSSATRVARDPQSRGNFTPRPTSDRNGRSSWVLQHLDNGACGDRIKTPFSTAVAKESRCTAKSRLCLSSIQTYLLCAHVPRLILPKSCILFGGWACSSFVCVNVVCTA
jgi:hypothetical protein